MAGIQSREDRLMEYVRLYLRVAREDLARASRARDVHVRNALSYGLSAAEVAALSGMSPVQVAEVAATMRVSA